MAKTRNRTRSATPEEPKAGLRRSSRIAKSPSPSVDSSPSAFKRAIKKGAKPAEPTIPEEPESTADDTAQATADAAEATPDAAAEATDDSAQATANAAAEPIDGTAQATADDAEPAASLEPSKPRARSGSQLSTTRSRKRKASPTDSTNNGPTVRDAEASPEPPKKRVRKSPSPKPRAAGSSRRSRSTRSASRKASSSQDVTIQETIPEEQDPTEATPADHDDQSASGNSPTHHDDTASVISTTEMNLNQAQSPHSESHFDSTATVVSTQEHSPSQTNTQNVQTELGGTQWDSVAGPSRGDQPVSQFDHADDAGMDTSSDMDMSFFTAPSRQGMSPTASIVYRTDGFNAMTPNKEMATPHKEMATFRDTVSVAQISGRMLESQYDRESKDRFIDQFQLALSSMGADKFAHVAYELCRTHRTLNEEIQAKTQHSSKLAAAVFEKDRLLRQQADSHEDEISAISSEHQQNLDKKQMELERQRAEFKEDAACEWNAKQCELETLRLQLDQVREKSREFEAAAAKAQQYRDALRQERAEQERKKQEARDNEVKVVIKGRDFQVQNCRSPEEAQHYYWLILRGVHPDHPEYGTLLKLIDCCAIWDRATLHMFQTAYMKKGWPLPPGDEPIDPSIVGHDEHQAQVRDWERKHFKKWVQPTLPPPTPPPAKTPPPPPPPDVEPRTVFTKDGYLLLNVNQDPDVEKMSKYQPQVYPHGVDESQTPEIFAPRGDSGIRKGYRIPQSLRGEYSYKTLPVNKRNKRWPQMVNKFREEHLLAAAKAPAQVSDAAKKNRDPVAERVREAYGDKENDWYSPFDGSMRGGVMKVKLKDLNRPNGVPPIPQYNSGRYGLEDNESSDEEENAEVGLPEAFVMAHLDTDKRQDLITADRGLLVGDTMQDHFCYGLTDDWYNAALVDTDLITEREARIMRDYESRFVGAKDSPQDDKWVKDQKRRGREWIVRTAENIGLSDWIDLKRRWRQFLADNGKQAPGLSRFELKRPRAATVFKPFQDRIVEEAASTNNPEAVGTDNPKAVAPDSHEAVAADNHEAVATDNHEAVATDSGEAEADTSGSPMSICAKSSPVEERRRSKLSQVSTPDAGSKPSEVSTPGAGSKPSEVSTPGAGSKPSEVSTAGTGSKLSEVSTPGAGSKPSAVSTPGDGSKPSQQNNGSAEHIRKTPSSSVAESTNAALKGGNGNQYDLGSREMRNVRRLIRLQLIQGIREAKLERERREAEHREQRQREREQKSEPPQQDREAEIREAAKQFYTNTGFVSATLARIKAERAAGTLSVKE